MLPSERQTIIDHKIRIVYLTNGEESPTLMLKVLLNRWEKLVLLDNITPRPFARFLSPRGVVTEKYRRFRL